LNEDVMFGPDGGDAQTGTVAFDPTQGILTLTPDQPLDADTAYVIHWPELRGIGTASAGRGADVRFTTGHDPDAAAPAFGGVTGLRWDLQRRQSDCNDDLEQRFVFDLDLGDADDDGGRDGLTLVVFQTASPSAPDQSVPVLTRALPAPGDGARVALATGGNVGRVCFAALARDLTGRSSSSGSQQLCVETTAPPFFRGCDVAAAPAGAGTSASGLGFAALALVAIIAARPGRRRHARRPTVSGGP